MRNWTQPWLRRPETRSADYSALLVKLIQSQAVAGLDGETSTSAVEAAAGSLSRAFASATVEAPAWAREAVSRRFLSRVGRDLVLLGESAHVIDVTPEGRVSLLPASGFGFMAGGPDPSTWRAEVSLTGPSITTTKTVRFEELVWVPWATDGDQPFRASGPVGSANITAKMLSEAEKSLRDESAGPLAQLIPTPRMDTADPNVDPEEDTVDPLAGLRQDIRTARGAGLLLETLAAGWGEGSMSAPRSDWKANRLGPNPPDSLVRLRRGRLRGGPGGRRGPAVPVRVGRRRHVPTGGAEALAPEPRPAAGRAGGGRADGEAGGPGPPQVRLLPEGPGRPGAGREAPGGLRRPAGHGAQGGGDRGLKC